jgi:Protein of unknown function (DUF3105)
MRHLNVLVIAFAFAVAGCGPAAPASSGATEPTGVIPTPAIGSSPTPDPGAASARDASPSPSSADATPAPVAAPVCASIGRPRLQSGSHLLGDQKPPVPYSSHPPTSGWHASGHLDVDVRDGDDPLNEPAQVSVLEAGGVVVTYGAVPDAQVARLAGRVRERHAGRVAVTPYQRLDDGEVAFTAWGVIQRCEGVDLTALDHFVRRFADDGPIEPGH